MLGFAQWNTPASHLKLHQHVMSCMTPPQCQCCSLFVALPSLHIFTTRWTTGYQLDDISVAASFLIILLVDLHLLHWHILTTIYCYTEPQLLLCMLFCLLGCLYNPLLTRKGLYDYWVASDSAAAIVTLYSLLVLSSHIIWHHCSIASKLSPSPVGSMSLFKVYCLISSTLVSLPKSRYLPSWTEELKYC